MNKNSTRNLVILIIVLGIFAGGFRYILNRSSRQLINVNDRIPAQIGNATDNDVYENIDVGLRFEYPNEFTVQPSSTAINYFINLIPDEVSEARNQGGEYYQNEYVIGFTFYKNRENLSVDNWVDEYIEENELDVAQVSNQVVADKDAVTFVINNEGVNIPGDKVYVFEHSVSGDIVFFYYLNEASVVESANIILDSIEFFASENTE